MRSTIIAGRKPVMEALKAGSQVERVVLLSGVHGTVIDQIRAVAERRRVNVVEVGKLEFRELARHTTTQGVLALVSSKQFVEVDDILALAEQRGEKAFVLVLDEIEDPQNLGALVRTAECAGVHGVIIPRHHAATVTAAVAKASAGATEYMPMAEVTNISSLLRDLKQRDCWVVGLDASGERSFTAVDYTTAIALVVGNEGRGIRRLVREHCDHLVHIPLLGKISSLNASVAGGLVMYEVVRQRRKLSG